MRRLSFLVCLIFLFSLMAGAVFAGDDITITVDGEEVEFEDVEPFIDDKDRTQVPIRFVGEELGAEVSWDDERQKATVEDEHRTVQFFVGDTEYIVDGEEREMDTTARIVDPGRVVIPARFVSDALGMDIEWFPDERIVAFETDVEVGPQAALQVERDSYEKNDVIEFGIENTGNTPITFEREFSVEYLIAERDDEESLLLPQEPVTQGLGEEEIPDDWLMRRRDTEDKLAVGELPGEELDVGWITGGQEIPISWVVVELDRIWPDEPTTLEPGETETQSFIPDVDFEEEARKGFYQVVKEISCEETGETFTLHDNFRIDIDTGFDADLQVKGEEFTFAEEVEFEVKNPGRTDIEFARPFSVARYEEGKWVEVELDMEFLDDIISLTPGETFQQGFVPEEDFANPAGVEEGDYIVTKLVWCSETDNSKVVVDEFRLTETDEESYFNPNIDAPDGVAPGEEFEFTLTVRNEGNVEDTQRVGVAINEETWDEEITLEPGEYWSESENITADPIVSEYDIELRTQDDFDSATVDVEPITPPEEAFFQPEIEAPEEVEYGEEFIVTFAVENTEDVEDTQEVYMRRIVDEEIGAQWSEEITLEPGETWADRETYTAVADESYRFEVETDDDSVTQRINVIKEEEAEFVIGIEAPGGVDVGEEFEVQVGVRNVGEAEGTQEVTVNMLANGEEETWTDTMTLAPGEVRTEEESFVAGEDIEEYRFRAKTEDDSASAVVEVIHYELH